MFAALLALPLLAQAVLGADSPGCARQYTIKAGDICDGISAANNVSTYQLFTLNPSIDAACATLQVGATLCLSPSAKENDCTTTHIVQPGDTCNKVMAGARIPSGDVFWGNNPQIERECGNMYVGEVLCIADKVQIPPGGSKAPVAPPPGAVPASPPPPPASTPPPPPSDGGKGGDDGGDGDDDEDLPFCDEL